MKHKRLIYTVIFLTYVVALSGFALAVEEPSIKTFGSYSRLVLPIDASASFKVQSASDNRIVLQIDRQRLPDWLDVKRIGDKRVSSLAMDQVGIDKVAVEIKLSDSNIDYFAYSQANPPAVIVDLWPKGLAQNAAPDTNKGRALAANSDAKEINIKKAANQKKKNETGFANVEPLDRQKNFFQSYPLPMPEYEFKGKLFQQPSDLQIARNWKWFKDDSASNEASAEALSLANTLFQKKKYALTIKTCEIFARDFGTSPKLPEVRFLQAIASRELGRANKNDELVKQAESNLKTLLEERLEGGKNHAFADTIRAYYAEKAMTEKNWFTAIENLELLLKSAERGSNDYQGIAISLANAYVAAKQYRRAERIYNFVAQEFPGQKNAKEAKYRIGSMLSEENNYVRAEKDILAALDTYPEYRSVRKEALFNLAEAQFWLGKNIQAIATYKKYIAENKSNTLAAIAYARLGELTELQSKNTNAAREYYFLAENGFPFTLGAQVAALRLARLDLNNAKERNYHIETLEGIYKGSNGDRVLKLIAQRNLIEYLLVDAQADRAIELVRDGMANGTMEEIKVFKEMYRRAVQVKLANFVKDKKFPEALAFYDTEKEWFAETSANSYKNLADAYRELGLYDSSNRFMSLYLDARKKEGRGLASVGAESIGLRIAKAKNSFAESKFGEVLTSLSGINSNEPEVARMRAVSYYRLGKPDEAYPHADRALQGMAENKKEYSTAQLQEQVSELGWILAQRGEKSRDFRDMQNSIERVQRLLPQKEERFEFLAVDAIWFQRRHQDALNGYKRLIEEYPKSDRIDRASYNMGMSYLALGKKTEAVKILTEISNRSQNVWAQSAKQELELLQWEQKYSSVLKSLPPSGLGIVN